MEYQQLVLDFAKRTRKNLGFIEKHINSPDAEVYEVTQLINSMLGLLVFPQQRYYELLPNIPLSELAERGWPKVEVLQGNPPCTNLKKLFRYLRNGIAHFNIEFTVDRDGQISGIHLWNKDERDKTNPNLWDILLSLSDLRLITFKFIELIESTAQDGHQKEAK